MATTVIHAKKRTESGSRYNRRLRRSGEVPGVYYIHGETPVALMFDHHDLNLFLHQSHALVDLRVEGDKTPRKCVIKDIQYHPVSEDILHVDLMGVKMGEKFTVSVPVHLVGEPIGLKAGGILEAPVRELDIECMPEHLPEHLEVDISNLNVGDSISVEDLKFDHITILNDPNEVIVLLDVPRVVEETVAAEISEELGEEEEGASQEESGD